jgi:tRNA (cmo5U34)-methyltransferase
MLQTQLNTLFDGQAASYDARWAKTAPIRDALYLLLDALFINLPANARILGVGVGTGTELAALAQSHPAWQFTAVEPSGAMLDECRKRAERDGFAHRCTFHHGTTDTVPAAELHDAATCFLVSQFILDAAARSRFFADIAARLKPGGLLCSSDLAADTTTPEFETVLHAWVTMMSSVGITSQAVENMRRAYTTDVAVIPPAQIEAIIRDGGFEHPTLFYQAGLIHAWQSQKPA